jgi:hypothetical protein
MPVAAITRSPGRRAAKASTTAAMTLPMVMHEQLNALLR